MNNEGLASIEMPRYKCHKEVWALKIKEVDTWTYDSMAVIVPEDDRYGAFGVSLEYVKKHKPEAGGYYVVYKDGYKSFSPASAFEEEYELIK